MFFCLDAKEPKNQARPEAPPAGQANAHEESVNCNGTTYRNDNLNHTASYYAKHRKALSFSLALFIDAVLLQQAKKKALEINL